MFFDTHLALVITINVNQISNPVVLAVNLAASFFFLGGGGEAVIVHLT